VAVAVVVGGGEEGRRKSKQPFENQTVGRGWLGGGCALPPAATTARFVPVVAPPSPLLFNTHQMAASSAAEGVGAVVVIGGGPALLAVAKGFLAAGAETAVTALVLPELYPGAALTASALTAAGITVVDTSIADAVAGKAVVVLADELCVATAGSPVLVDLLAAAASAGVRLLARWSFVNANGGSWMKHRFGASAFLTAHNAADVVVAKSGGALLPRCPPPPLSGTLRWPARSRAGAAPCSCSSRMWCVLHPVPCTFVHAGLTVETFGECGFRAPLCMRDVVP
jgi:hypothetical protein